MIRVSPRSTLFPYTTLFRSVTEFSDAQEIAKIVQRQLDLFGLALEDLAERLARDLGQLALERADAGFRSEEHTSELQSLTKLVCRLLLEKKNTEWVCMHQAG